MSYILEYLRRGKNASYAVGVRGEVEGRFDFASSEFVAKGAKVFSYEEAKEVRSPKGFLRVWLDAKGLSSKGVYSAIFTIGGD